MKSLICFGCRNKFEMGYCKHCYWESQGALLKRVMDGTAEVQFTEIREKQWDFEDKINDLKNSIDEIRESLKDFKIRGFRLKSTKK